MDETTAERAYRAQMALKALARDAKRCIPAMALALCAAATPALATTIDFEPAKDCLPAGEALTRLLERRGEAPVWRGLLPDGRVVVRTERPGGSWTLVVLVTPDVACALLHGGHGGTDSPGRRVRT